MKILIKLHKKLNPVFLNNKYNFTTNGLNLKLIINKNLRLNFIFI